MLSVGGVAGAGWKLTISGRGVVSAAGWGDGPIRRSGRRRTSTKSVPGTPGFRPGTSALVPVLDAGTEESEIQLAKDDTVACTEPASLDVGSGGVHSSQGSIIWSPQTSQRPRLPSALARRAPRSALPYEYCMRTSNKIHVPHARTDYVTPHFAAQRAQAAREHNNSFSHSAPVAARQPERASSPAPGATSAAWRGRVVGSAATHRLTHSLQQLPFLLPRAAWPHARKASVSHSAPEAARQPERASSPAPGATRAAWRGRVVGSAGPRTASRTPCSSFRSCYHAPPGHTAHTHAKHLSFLSRTTMTTTSEEVVASPAAQLPAAQFLAARLVPEHGAMSGSP